MSSAGPTITITGDLGRLREATRRLLPPHMPAHRNSRHSVVEFALGVRFRHADPAAYLAGMVRAALAQLAGMFVAQPEPARPDESTDPPLRLHLHALTIAPSAPPLALTG